MRWFHEAGPQTTTVGEQPGLNSGTTSSATPDCCAVPKSDPVRGVQLDLPARHITGQHQQDGAFQVRLVASAVDIYPFWTWLSVATCEPTGWI
jgi:hypothetical protein